MTTPPWLSFYFSRQIVSVLLSANDSSSGTEVSLDLLGNLGKAVALGSEAGEDLDQISAESLDLQVRRPKKIIRRVEYTSVLLIVLLVLSIVIMCASAIPRVMSVRKTCMKVGQTNRIEYITAK